MTADSALFTVILLALLGLLLSVGMERFLKPRPLLRRPAGVWAVHVGLWCAVYGVLVLLSGRPWCAVAGMSALVATLVLVNNAKRQRLREPFIFQDYEYFLDTLRYPRLFLPFLGWQKFLLATLCFVLALAGFLYESAPQARFALNGQLGGTAAVLGLAALLLGHALRCPLSVSFTPEHDMLRFGLLTSLWAYGLAERTPPDAPSPFRRAVIPHCPMPHLVAVQSESFFDPRALYSGIRNDVLRSFDLVRAEAACCGALDVPAWGANTVRTECAFLTGITPRNLGVHQFNPYRAMARGWQTASLPLLLRSLGYRTVCIHPYQAKFYNRDDVFVRLGFDAFMDIRTFSGAQRFGSFVADAAVEKAIVRVLRSATTPVFVFAITMENHGPLHLERVHPPDAAELYTEQPPTDCDELTIYLRHLRNADAMLDGLHATLTSCEHPASLCWFGDHVPIMPGVYKALGTPCGDVPYLVWNNQSSATPQGAQHAAGNSGTGCRLPAHSLALVWIQAAGLYMSDNC